MILISRDMRRSQSMIDFYYEMNWVIYIYNKPIGWG